MRITTIKLKLILICLLTTGVVLLLSTVILIVNEFLSNRRLLINELTVQAKIVGANSTAALSFDDSMAAEETLNALRVSPNIITAAIYSKDGNVFAQLNYYKDQKDEILPPAPQQDGYHIGMRRIDIFHSIVLDGEIIGAIYIRASLKELYTHLMWYAGTICAVAIFSLGIAFLILLKLQQKITRPILSLRQATGKIAGGDLAARAEVMSSDELGDLAVSFNMMTENLQETTVSKNYVDNIIKNMRECLVVISPEGKIKTTNRSALHLLGYTDDELLNQPVEMIFGEELSFDELILSGLLKEESTSIVEKILFSKDGRKIPVIFSASEMLDADKNLQGIICIALDITERKKAEGQIKASLKEKEVLLREIHHRVKNNMQIISSMLRLQTRYIKDEKDIKVLLDCRNRIKSMSLIHEKLYRSKDMAKIKFKGYIVSLTRYIYRSFGVDNAVIDLKINIDDIFLGIDAAIPCGLIINELMSNSLKHAFPKGKGGEIKITMHRISDFGLPWPRPQGGSHQGRPKSEIELVVSDNGVGISEKLDFRNTSSMGLKLVTTLVKQLQGKIELNRDGGVEWGIRFRN